MKTEDLIAIFRLGLPHHKIVEVVNSLQVHIEGKIYTIKKPRQSHEGKIKYTNIEDYINAAEIFERDDIDSGKVSLDWLNNENIYVGADALSDASLMMYRKYRSQFTDEEPVHLVEVIVESYEWSERSFYTFRDYDDLGKYQSGKFLNKVRELKQHADVIIDITLFASRKDVAKVLPLYELAKLYPDARKFKKKFTKKLW